MIDYKAGAVFISIQNSRKFNILFEIIYVKFHPKTTVPGLLASGSGLKGLHVSHGQGMSILGCASFNFISRNILASISEVCARGGECARGCLFWCCVFFSWCLLGFYFICRYNCELPLKVAVGY